MNNLSLAICLILDVAIASTAAQAGPLTAVDIFKPGGTVPIATGVQTLKWQDGANVSIGFTGLPNSIFVNLYQSTLNSLLDQNSNLISAAPGLGLAFSDPNAYEFSIVSRVQFRVSPTTATTLFELVPSSGTLSIYLDGPGVGSAGVKADPTSGIGYDDGIEIFRAVPYSGSAFVKGTDIVDELELVASMVRTDILSSPVPIGDFHFTDIKRLTPTLAPNGFHVNGDVLLYPDYTPQSGDALIDLINSNAQFSTVPEPNTFLLSSLSLIVWAIGKRRFPRRGMRRVSVPPSATPRD